ncbi:MAG: uracil-DNA glycosylase [Mesorhizobium sp.]|uniref:uracil-DNA glycosylase n=1 Tax=unclassified Mesorhizobium TaxID=325217 RepID=UPI000BB05DC1|nr:MULTISPECIES: uracil-DNA glycosylase [unclassified Mesorhizobium]TGV91676.1 uracil-DNA glycosylase [Mesorhizobium sp. M00.F.Ca.ET.158.01.1.1]WIE90705.1 uracil-DNA glycosylase family protein [Mesorhizobium sp. WSM4875]AZO58891.1 uracil-DNA glycosylase [Mesorhizobium sp. M1A.F.Ca.IN.022.06.1.1]MCT2579027.1 uracil-DNA glycosylase [Mesorhizobium sp. P13.3]MDF3167967.1 uracil-DNA glycosylase family protein [Mesorhizobium sp. P16.1]
MTAASPNNPIDIAELLAFYASAGVDEALEDTPVNRFAEAKPKQAERAPAQAATARESMPLERPASEPGLEAGRAAERPAASTGLDASQVPDAPRRPTLTTATVPDEGQIKLARQLAASASTLDELRQQMAAFDGCNLKFTAKNLVFADGNPNADLMLVGEAPGRDEDLEGLPFVGRSGRLLDSMLAAIGLDRTSAYIANVIPWRPPGNRTPTPHETEICRPFIERQIELVNPKVLVNLGGPSAKTLLNTTEGILRLRGNWRVHTTQSGIAIPAMPTLHPAYLLRTPAHKKLAWRDFLEVKAKLRALG